MLRAWLLAAVAVLSLQSQTLNSNLIVNGGAESGPGAAQPTAAQVSSIPGWTTTGGFSVGIYEPNFLQPKDYGPVGRGSQLFYGGPGNQRSTATQTIDLAALSASIDAGSIKFYLSGYLGLIAGDYDNIHSINLKADFLDATGAVLLSSTAYGPNVADVNLPTGLFYRAATGFLPPNVRKVKVTLDLASNSSGYNGYAADNLSLVLTTDPMMGANLLANPNGEADPGPVYPDNPAPIPGWNSDSLFTVWKWGDYKMPATTDSGPSDRGKYFFSCPTSHDQCAAFQTVDFSAAKSLVDSNKVTFEVSGWLGGDSVMPDNVGMNVTFYDANGAAMQNGSYDVAPVLLAERNSRMGVWFRSVGGTVPSGSRRAQVSLLFHKLGPASENLYAYADDLVFQLDSIQINSVVNAASSQAGPVAPGEFVTLYGTSLGPSAGVSGMQKGLGHVQVFFNGVEAWLTYVSAGQINALVPYGVSGKADATVKYNGNTSAAFPLSVTTAAPGIFTQQYGVGQVWAVNNADFTFNSSGNPVARGQYISMWATGQGTVTPDGQDGEMLSAYKTVILPVKLTIGGSEVQSLWAGLIYTGEIQVQGIVPTDIPAGNAEVLLTIGSTVSRKGATIAVK